MIEQMRFRVISPNCKEAILDWNTTLDVLESGDWSSIQVLEEENDE
jgi:hypothetical protein